jgi:hypothetical protein
MHLDTTTIVVNTIITVHRADWRLVLNEVSVVASMLLNFQQTCCTSQHP